jgi:hypothetical protein
MGEDLINKLRTCPQEQRRKVSIELAKTKTHEAVQEIIRMIKGSRIRGIKFYNYHDQLSGIIAATKQKAMSF